MRTKTLLLTAAVSAAGVATSMAQVFSVNAVGYVNKTIPANSFALISNPLTAADNRINELFKGVPPGTQIYKFNGTGFDTATFDALDNAFLWSPTTASNTELKPGEGAFVKNNGTTPLTITFVGEVPQGTQVNPLPAGLSVKSSIIPQRGTISDPNFGYTAAAGDQIYQFNTGTQKYDVFTFDSLDNAWLNSQNQPVAPVIEVGDAFFLRKPAGTATSWTRTFNVNAQ
jgi:hypothetical protein